MIPRFIPYQPPASGGGGHDADVTAWMNAVVTAGGTVSAGRRTLLDTLVTAGKSNGWWTLLDYLLIMAAENSQSALIDIKGLRTATLAGSPLPTFTVDQGIAGNGSSNYTNSGFNPSTMGVNYTQNSATIGLWDRTNPGTGNQITFASEFNTNGSGLAIPNGSTTGFYQVNAAGASVISATTRNGFWMATRTASNAVTCYKNGASVATDTPVSNAIPSAPFAIGGDFSGGGPAGPLSSDQLAIVCAGGNMTSVASSFYTNLQTFATAVGF